MSEVENETVVNEEKQEKKESPYGPNIPADFNIDQYKILNKEEYTVENLIINGKVFAQIQVTPKISTTFRSLSINELQDLELQVYKDDDEGIRYSMNEITLRPTIKSMTAMSLSGKDIVFPTDEALKSEQIRAMSIPVINEMVAAYRWFALRTIVLVRGSDLKNS